MNEEEDIIGTDVVPIAKLAGDDYICLDYRKSEELQLQYGMAENRKSFIRSCAK